MQIENHGGYLTSFRCSPTNLKTTNILTLKKAFKNKINAFPKDMAYFKQLGKNIKLPDANLFKLTSIIGPEELKNILSGASREAFNVGEDFTKSQLTKSDYENLAKRGFSFNLHIHTNHSDGMMSVKDLLEQASEYANTLKEINPSSRFIIAITDHDTLESNKEALKIISKNPKKYENLGVVLGVELSAAYKNSEMFNSPLTYEMIAYSINPFETSLNEDLLTLRNNRINLSKKIIESAKKLYPEYNFSYEELCKTSKNPQKGINGFLYPIANYLKDKTNGLKDIENLSLKYLPDMNNNVIINNIENIFSKMKNNFGFLGIAHPGKIFLGDGKIKNDFIKKCKSEKQDTGTVIIKRFLQYLKNIGGDKFNAMETNYQSYFGLLKEAQNIIFNNKEVDKRVKDSVKWLNIFHNFVNENKLLNTGGLDSHSENPFKKR